MPTQPASTLTNGVHHTEVRVRFGDTDPYGIVYFVSYFRYCHRAIEEFLRACGLPPDETFKNVPEGFGLPIMESLWHGKPCLCAGFGAMGEIAEGGGCLTVDVRFSAEIFDGIRRLVFDRELRRRLARVLAESAALPGGHRILILKVSGTG